MKKFLKVAAVVIGFSMLAAGCGSADENVGGADSGDAGEAQAADEVEEAEEGESADDSNASPDEWFKWSSDTEISGMALDHFEETVIVVPSKCTGFTFNYGYGNIPAVEEITFLNPDTELGTIESSVLRKIVLPENLTQIPARCFVDCSARESVTMYPAEIVIEYLD